MPRRIRKDSKLHSLPPDQRARVDRWLFDKGLTYAQVAQACAAMFGLQLSKSSVARYFQTETLARVEARRQSGLCARRAVAEAADRAYTGTLTPKQRYDLLFERIGLRCLDLMNTLGEPLDHKTLCSCMRLLIAARREQHMATRVWVERKKFELWAAKQCLKHLQSQCRSSPAARDKEAPSHGMRKSFSPAYLLPEELPHDNRSSRRLPAVGLAKAGEALTSMTGAHNWPPPNLPARSLRLVNRKS